MENKLSVIGYGKMGSAITEIVLQKNWNVYVYDIKKPNTISDKLTWVSQPKDLPNLPILLAVKPNNIESLLKSFSFTNPILSIAAGVEIKSMQKYTSAPIVRAMPNTPARIGKGTTALFFPETISQEIKKFARSLFGMLGDIVEVKEENDLHTITALSGSGPAYVQLFAQSLEDAGVSHGLSRDTARALVVSLINGTGAYIKEKNISPQELIHEVTSPGGTTIAGLNALKKAGFESAVHEAVLAAKEKSISLG